MNADQNQILLAAAKLAIAHGHRWAWHLRNEFLAELGDDDLFTQFDPSEEVYALLGSHQAGRWANAAFASACLPAGEWTDEAIRAAVLAEQPEMFPEGEAMPIRDDDGRIVHTTATGRTRWRVGPTHASDGATKIEIEIRRPDLGAVLTAEVYVRRDPSQAPDAYLHVEGRYCRRHVAALLRCLIAFFGEDEALRLCAERSLIECATPEAEDERLNIFEALDTLEQRFQSSFALLVA